MGLPGGTVAIRVQERHVYLSPKLKINHGLYKLKCNLVSVSQLVKEHEFLRQLLINGLFVQDHISRMSIGVGRQKDKI